MTASTVLYDGDCGFCTAFVAAAERRLDTPVSVVAWQAADLDGLRVPAADAQRALQWLGADGKREQGHRAVAAWLTGAGGAWRVLGALLVAPGLSPLAAGAYRVVAANRGRIPGTGAGSCAVATRPGP